MLINVDDESNVNKHRPRSQDFGRLIFYVLDAPSGVKAYSK